jgi:peroxiredoxin
MTLCFLVSVGMSGQINAEHLEVGQQAPRIKATDQNGKSIDSKVILENEKILLVFYRGNWCPHCKKHLGELEKNLTALKEKGVFVLVVTPESVEKTKETQEKFNTSFSIVHDSGNQIMKDYKVAFEVNESNVPNYYDKITELVDEYNSESEKVLPVPATYLIGTDERIEYVQYDPDYKNRSDISEIVNSL